MAADVRIVIYGIQDQPVRIDCSAFILATTNDPTAQDTASFGHGDRRQTTTMAGILLYSLRKQFGAKAVQQALDVSKINPESDDVLFGKVPLRCAVPDADTPEKP